MAAHIYRLADGTRVPGVTTIINSQSGWNKEPLKWWAWKQGMAGKNLRDEKDAAADIGTVAHMMIESHIRGIEFDHANLPANLLIAWETGMPGLAYEAWLEWIEKNRVEILCAEMSVVSERFKVGGTFDAISLNDYRALLDWKTASGIYDESLIQGAAYAEIYNELYPDEPIERVGIVRLGKESPTITDYTFPVGSELYDVLVRQFEIWRESYENKKLIKRLS